MFWSQTLVRKPPNKKKTSSGFSATQLKFDPQSENQCPKLLQQLRYVIGRIDYRQNNEYRMQDSSRKCTHKAASEGASENISPNLFSFMQTKRSRVLEKNLEKIEQLETSLIKTLTKDKAEQNIEIKT